MSKKTISLVFVLFIINVCKGIFDFNGGKLTIYELTVKQVYKNLENLLLHQESSIKYTYAAIAMPPYKGGVFCKEDTKILLKKKRFLLRLKNVTISFWTRLKVIVVFFHNSQHQKFFQPKHLNLFLWSTRTLSDLFFNGHFF